MLKKLFIILFVFSSLASSAQAADLPLKNAGFVPSNIWYSKDPFFAGETVRVYTIIFNGSKYDLSGGAEFLDNGVVIGKTKFALSGNGRVQDLWTDWKATPGAHTITARLTNVIADGPNGKQAALLDNAEAGKSDRVIELDPALVEAQKKADEQKIAEVKKQAIGKVEEVMNTVSGSIPTPVKAGATVGANTIEKFRIGEAYQFQLSKENKLKQIDAMKLATTTSPNKKNDAIETFSNDIEKPVAYVTYAAYALLQYLFQWMILFYGVSFYIIYRLIKWLVRKVRDR